MVAKLWIEDDISYDRTWMDRGDTWSSDGGDATYPAVRRPIGFMRSKPRVRVKAWTQPIVVND